MAGNVDRFPVGRSATRESRQTVCRLIHNGCAISGDPCLGNSPLHSSRYHRTANAKTLVALVKLMLFLLEELDIESISLEVDRERERGGGVD